MMDGLISRQAAIDTLCDNCDHVEAVCPHYPCKQYIAIENLPSAQPERKTGTWQKCGKDCRGYSDTYECSECGCLVQYAYYVTAIDYDFCPHCGARMEE